MLTSFRPSGTHQRMNSHQRLIVGAWMVLFAAAGSLGQLPADVKSDLGPDVPAFRVRPGYKVTRAAARDAVREARFLQFSADGKTLFVSQIESGKIIALRDPDQD